MNRRPFRSLAVFGLVFASAAALMACGGTALAPSFDGEAPSGDGGACEIVLPCPSNAPWNPDTCACEAVRDSGAPFVVDAMAECPEITCPSGSALSLLDGACVCLIVPRDAGPDGTTAEYDAPYVPPPPYDATYYPPPPYPDASIYYPDTGTAYYPDGGPFCGYYPPGYPYACPSGYTLGPNCTCDLCSATCPIGEQPGPGCNGCTTCTTTCPAGFDYGPSCGCVPQGVDAGPPAPPDAGDAGVSCLIEGYNTCAPDTWCALGTCPNGTTQYGCYCDHDGKATCSLSCPVPAPCEIPGQASCPVGQSCIYGSCASDPNGDLLVCTCNTYSYYGSDAGSASCYTASCADGGPQYLPDAGQPNDGGVSCLLEGYTYCNAGSFCPIATCPGGTSVGCFCNQDGTSTCDLTCPPVAPCEIPGEGTCPYGTSCVFGCGGGTTGTGLSCYCQWGGGASCSTEPCSELATLVDGG
jgi:hypothetical protein